MRLATSVLTIGQVIDCAVQTDHLPTVRLWLHLRHVVLVDTKHATRVIQQHVLLQILAGFSWRSASHILLRRGLDLPILKVVLTVVVANHVEVAVVHLLQEA